MWRPPSEDRGAMKELRKSGVSDPARESLSKVRCDQKKNEEGCSPSMNELRMRKKSRRRRGRFLVALSSFFHQADGESDVEWRPELWREAAAEHGWRKFSGGL